MSTPKNHHFVSQFLTRPWEGPPQRSLHYFDLATGKIERHASRTLLARLYLNSPATEKFLSTHVETIVGNYRTRCDAAGGVAVGFDDPPTYRALMCLALLQVGRAGQALSSAYSGVKLDELLSKGERAFDELQYVGHQHHELLVVTMRRETLFYPETGFFTVPLLGNEWGAIVVPLTPRIAIVLYPRGVSTDALRAHLDTRSRMTGFSLASSGLATKFVVPINDLQPVPDEERVKGFLEMREGSRRIVDLVGKQNIALGLKGYGFGDPA